MAATYPTLREIPISVVQSLPLPTQKIKTDEHVDTWRQTRGYQDYALFLRRLNASVMTHFLPWSSPKTYPAVQSTVHLLDALDRWIDEIPPLPTPQRFGNLAFRAWGKRLNDECNSLLHNLLPSQSHPAIPYIAPYLLTSFGSFTRMDYGTGHETSFALFLLCLVLIRFFNPEPDMEREIVLTIFVRYLRLCWRLQDVYKLEPAGSHGVWGLDDYSFLGYIFGSGQLKDQIDTPVSAILHPPLPPTNLYFLSITRIRDVKTGPFHEHSSQLYSIATGVQLWSKVNSGLFKMYEAEVLGKRVVVQHLPLGGLVEWDSSDRTEATASILAQTSLPPPTQAQWSPTTSPGTSVPLPTVYPAPPPLMSAQPAARPVYTGLHGGRSGFMSMPSTTRSGTITPAQAPLGPLASPTLRATPRAQRHAPDYHPTSASPPPPPGQ